MTDHLLEVHNIVLRYVCVPYNIVLQYVCVPYFTWCHTCMRVQTWHQMINVFKLNLILKTSHTHTTTHTHTHTHTHKHTHIHTLTSEQITKQRTYIHWIRLQAEKKQMKGSMSVMLYENRIQTRKSKCSVNLHSQQENIDVIVFFKLSCDQKGSKSPNTKEMCTA